MITMSDKVLAVIHHMGYPYFVLLLIIDIILWKVHPVLGLLGVAFTVALLFGVL